MGGDMIVGLMNLPERKTNGTVEIKRAFPGDKEKILHFIAENFQASWVWEAEHALLQPVSQCFIAVENEKILGFACYDSSARGFFGPIGVAEEARGHGIGAALLLRTLSAMREYGYAYAIIGWVTDAAPFYEKTVGASFIPDGNPKNSIYKNMIVPPKE